MAKLSLTFIFSCLVSFCFGQYKYKLVKDTSASKKSPFKVINTDERTGFKAYSSVLDYGLVKKIEIDSTGKYSKKGDIIWAYTFKAGVKTLTTDEMLANYHISKKYRDLPVYIDSVIIHDRQSACFQPSAIVFVKVQKEKDTYAKYIYVRTIHYANNPFAGVYMYGTWTKKKEDN